MLQEQVNGVSDGICDSWNNDFSRTPQSLVSPWQHWMLMNFEPQSRFFYTAPGIRLHAKVCGPEGAPVLLFVHGFPEFWFTWRHQLSEFASTHRCVALDLRGFNLSSQPADVAAYKASNILADLRAVIQQLGGAVEAVVAHDWGGALCWNLAAQSPELLRKLVILNAPHTVLFAHAMAHDPAQMAASQYMNTLRREGAEARLAGDEFASLRRMLGPLELNPDERAQYLACWRLGLRGGCNFYRASPLHPDTPDTPGAMAAVAQQLKPEDFTVRVPTQVIWGLGDSALRPVLLEGLNAMVPNLRLHTIADAGHWLPHANAAEVNRVLREFLNIQPA